MGIAIIMQDDELKGIITDGDIRRTLSKQGAAALTTTAQEIMTTNPKTISSHCYLAEAENFMKENKIHSLIALDENNKVVGLIEFLS